MGHSVDLEPALDQQFLHVAKREPEQQLRANREDNHVRREPKAHEHRRQYREALAKAGLSHHPVPPLATQCNSARKGHTGGSA